MKKYFIYLMMALAAVTLNACGDDDPVQKNNREPNSPKHRMNRTNLILPTNLRETVIFSLPTLPIATIPALWLNASPN